MKQQVLICLLLLTGLTISCGKKDNLDVPLNGLGGDIWEKTPLDKWLYDSIVKPTNIEIKYKWDQSEFDMQYTLVPPVEHRVIPTAQAILRLWVEPFNQEAGADLFMKTYAPKQIVLSGSPALNKDGSGVAGLAEGGLKVLLFTINSFDQKNIGAVNNMTQLLHHEFTHILNQKKAYPLEYNKITPGDYTGAWTVATENPLTLGFISNYARKEPGEDIAEMVSWMLVLGKKGYEDYLASVPDNASGIAKLRQKEALVVRYFKESYKLDFYSLQTRVQAAMKELTK